MYGLFQISSMTNPLVFTPKCLELPLLFSTGPSKLFEFSRNCEVFPTWVERESGGAARTRANTAYVNIRQHTSVTVNRRQRVSGGPARTRTNATYVSICEHTSSYVSIRQRETAAAQHELARTAPTRSWALFPNKTDKPCTGLFFRWVSSVAVIAWGACVRNSWEYSVYFCCKYKSTNTDT